MGTETPAGFPFHGVLSVAAGVLLLWIVRHGLPIHLTYLAAVLSGVAMGWLQPRRGWILAVIQVLVLGLGYFLFTGYFSGTDYEQFSLFGSMGLVLAGGFMGGVLKRNIG